ncbi:uncharacterized protein B0H64DRAFT_349732 [Chaetomium fimeti]|uniref:ATP-grasp domain-containing protein n=1 Tax=Chaetomium fimeti TaxID=1854472 RepID=A0AAE0H6M8_9PEZI|nr:hypothetical protein B0H64DRAFT_349732 [Chaetomium fimeti]
MAEAASSSPTPGLDWTVALQFNGSTAHLRTLQAAVAGGTQSHWSLDFEAVLVDDATTAAASTTKLIHLDVKDLEDAHSTLLTTNLFDALAHGKDASGNRSTMLRLLFPAHSGTPARSDVLEYRLRGSSIVHTVRSFLQPLTPVTATTPTSAHGITTPQTLLHLLSTAMGGIVAQSRVLNTTTLTDMLTTDLTYRLSLPYLLPTQPHQKEKKRIFWIQGRANITASHQFYAAARALGLTLVVADAPGHWMQPDDGPHAHFREAFVPLDIAGDAGLADRIVAAVRAYPEKVDGVVCISDVRLPAVARACEVLGLPTEQAGAYVVAGDKGRTRRAEIEAKAAVGNEGDAEEGFVLGEAGELEGVLKERGGRELVFPLIVKPCTGWNSDCVVKVRDLEELRAAVRRASARHKDSPAKNTGVVVEPYVDGPEVDANFVLLDGEVLFCDVTDDFPCSGDLVEGSPAANFMETLMDVPTALPQNEQVMVVESLRQSIKRCGFASGIFHCEARVRNSNGYYTPRLDNGILDLHVRSGSVEKSPSCYLHEVNARPPGYINCVAALLAYGVDYYAIRLLLALGPGENDRIKALAQPFLGGKPQYTLGIAVLPPTREGVMGSEDAVGEFLEANPDLRQHVVFHQTVKERGEVVQGPDSSELWCVGYVIVASREGRKACLELAQSVRERFDYKLLDE